MRKSILFLIVLWAVASLVTAGSFDFRGTTDKPGVNEEMGDILEAVTNTHLAELKGGSVSTKEGKTNYAQFIRFKDTATAINSSSARYTITGSSEVGEFLKVNKGTTITDAFFEYHLNFEEGLKSKIADKRLDSLDDAKFNIFNNEYTIINSAVDGKQIKLTLARGAINDMLREKEKKIYTIGEKSYEIEIVTIEKTTKSVSLRVANKETKQLKKGEIEKVDADIFIGVSDVIISSDQAGSAAKFFIGASILEIQDDNYEDNTFSRDVSINKEKIGDAFVKISASLVGEVLKINAIKYRLITKESIYVRPGDGMKKSIEKPEGMLADWDIKFAGFETVATSKIRFIPSAASDEYRLEFTSSEGKTINIPFISNKGGTFKRGDADKDLIVVEGTSTTNFVIDKNDYFVLTSANTKSGKTYVWIYEGVNNDTNEIIFTEVGGSQKKINYQNSSESGALGEGALASGVINAKFYIDDDSPYPISVDMNGDNDVASDQIDIVVKGGGILDPGTSNTLAGSTQDIVLTTEGSQFEESTSAEAITFTVQAATPIGISETITGVATVKSKTNHVLGLSEYGVKIDMISSSDKADDLTIDYPMSQVFAKILLEIGLSSKIQTKVEQPKEERCKNSKQDGDETGIDCGGSCDPCPSCSDGVKNQDETGIDCGGSCPNACPPSQPLPEACKGCMQQLDQGKKKCLAYGERAGTLYCSSRGVLIPLKAYGEACQAAYECKVSRCEEGKCGKRLTTGVILTNSIIILLVLAILYYGFTLLKRP